MSWASEDLKYKICKLQEFGILSDLDFSLDIQNLCDLLSQASYLQ